MNETFTKPKLSTQLNTLKHITQYIHNTSRHPTATSKPATTTHGASTDKNGCPCAAITPQNHTASTCLLTSQQLTLLTCWPSQAALLWMLLYIAHDFAPVSTITVTEHSLQPHTFTQQPPSQQPNLPPSLYHHSPQY